MLRLHASNAGGAGSIPGRGTKIPHAVWCGQKKNNNNNNLNFLHSKGIKIPTRKISYITEINNIKIKISCSNKNNNRFYYC